MSIKDLTIQRDTFAVETTRQQPRQLHVAFSGCADLRVQSEFSMLIHRIHEEARLMNVHVVNVNLDKLEFLSSGCFKALCTWARLLLGREGSYKLRILSNPRYHWQVRSLNALQLLAPNAISIENIDSK
jgi:hypothetical protein